MGKRADDRRDRATSTETQTCCIFSPCLRLRGHPDTMRHPAVAGCRRVSDQRRSKRSPLMTSFYERKSSATMLVHDSTSIWPIRCCWRNKIECGSYVSPTLAHTHFRPSLCSNLWHVIHQLTSLSLSRSVYHPEILLGLSVTQPELKTQPSVAY
jgi:hypothetical protein